MTGRDTRRMRQKIGRLSSRAALPTTNQGGGNHSSCSGEVAVRSPRRGEMLMRPRGMQAFCSGIGGSLTPGNQIVWQLALRIGNRGHSGHATYDLVASERGRDHACLRPSWSRAFTRTSRSSAQASPRAQLSTICLRVAGEVRARCLGSGRRASKHRVLARCCTPQVHAVVCRR